MNDERNLPTWKVILTITREVKAFTSAEAIAQAWFSIKKKSSIDNVSECEKTVYPVLEEPK